jgi:hypothetical protein
VFSASPFFLGTGPSSGARARSGPSHVPPSLHRPFWRPCSQWPVPQSLHRPLSNAPGARARSGPCRSPCTGPSGARRARSGPCCRSPCTGPSGARARSGRRSRAAVLLEFLHRPFRRPCWQWSVLAVLRRPFRRPCSQQLRSALLRTCSSGARASSSPCRTKSLLAAALRAPVLAVAHAAVFDRCAKRKEIQNRVKSSYPCTQIFTWSD